MADLPLRILHLVERRRPHDLHLLLQPLAPALRQIQLDAVPQLRRRPLQRHDQHAHLQLPQQHLHIGVRQGDDVIEGKDLLGDAFAKVLVHLVQRLKHLLAAGRRHAANEFDHELQRDLGGAAQARMGGAQLHVERGGQRLHGPGGRTGNMRRAIGDVSGGCAVHVGQQLRGVRSGQVAENGGDGLAVFVAQDAPEYCRLQLIEPGQDDQAIGIGLLQRSRLRGAEGVVQKRAGIGGPAQTGPGVGHGDELIDRLIELLGRDVPQMADLVPQSQHLAHRQGRAHLCRQVFTQRRDDDGGFAQARRLRNDLAHVAAAISPVSL